MNGAVQVLLSRSNSVAYVDGETKEAAERVVLIRMRWDRCTVD